MIVRINGHAYELAEKTELKTEFLSLLFPVGYVMILTTNVDPNKTIGGTWQKIKTGKFLEATENNAELKQEMQPGLPNLWGELRLDDHQSIDSGVFRIMRHLNLDLNSRLGGNGRIIEFNAGIYNSIYGRSSTVQPSSIKVAMWQRIA